MWTFNFFAMNIFLFNFPQTFLKKFSTTPRDCNLQAITISENILMKLNLGTSFCSTVITSMHIAKKILRYVCSILVRFENFCFLSYFASDNIIYFLLFLSEIFHDCHSKMNMLMLKISSYLVM